MTKLATSWLLTLLVSSTVVACGAGADENASDTMIGGVELSPIESAAAADVTPTEVVETAVAPVGGNAPTAVNEAVATPVMVTPAPEAEPEEVAAPVAVELPPSDPTESSPPEVPNSGDNGQAGVAVEIQVTGDPERGRFVFAEPMQGGNTFACATCHALSEPALDAFRRPGHPMDNVLSRPNYKNGRLEHFVDAANSCRNDWMNLPEPWTESSEDYAHLVAFLEQETGAASETAEALEFTIEQPPATADLMNGSMAAGQELFNTTCAVCHGQDATGTNTAPALVGARLTVDFIAQRVRLSGSPASVAYEGLQGGRMPFWSKERLSDAELADIVAFTMNVDGQAPAEAPEPANDGLRECEATHEKVGQLAELRNFSHDISGTAEIVDDCTIRISNFGFDGGGIDVRIYGGIDGDYDGGFALTGDNLVRRNPYIDETLTIQLPEGRSLDDLDGVSVWCVPIGINFGDGRFL